MEKTEKYEDFLKAVVGEVNQGGKYFEDGFICLQDDSVQIHFLRELPIRKISLDLGDGALGIVHCINDVETILANYKKYVNKVRFFEGDFVEYDEKPFFVWCEKRASLLDSSAIEELLKTAETEMAPKNYDAFLLRKLANVLEGMEKAVREKGETFPIREDAEEEFWEWLFNYMLRPRHFWSSPRRPWGS